MGNQWEGMEMLEIFAYRTVTVVHFTDQNRISKTIVVTMLKPCVKVCDGLQNWFYAKISLFRVSMVVTYYIKLYQTGADRHSSILMSLLLLVEDN